RFFGNRRKAVAGQIDQVTEVAVWIRWVRHAKHVDEASPTGRFAGKRQPPLLSQYIDGGGLAGVGAPDEADFGSRRRRKLIEPGRRRGEMSAMEKRHVCKCGQHIKKSIIHCSAPGPIPGS